jgi:hypothetical protein
MNENKYEQRVRERAEEFAVTDHPISFQLYKKYSELPPDMRSWSMTFYVNNWRIIVDKYAEIARLSVQREAEAVEQALEFLHQSIYNSELGKMHSARYLQSIGLVPENEPDQEAGKV